MNKKQLWLIGCALLWLGQCVWAAPTTRGKAENVAQMAGYNLAMARNCLSCHAIDKRVVGPSYREVALRYKGDKGALDKLVTKIQKGGGGVWGAIPMPPNPQVNADEAKKLAAWVLSQ
jgi:cytochrome c